MLKKKLFRNTNMQENIKYEYISELQTANAYSKILTFMQSKKTLKR